MTTAEIIFGVWVLAVIIIVIVALRAPDEPPHGG